MDEMKIHASIYVGGETGVHPRVVHNIVKLERPEPAGYTWHGMACYRGLLVVVGSYAHDALIWCDLNIPMRHARRLINQYIQEAGHATT